MRQLKPCVRRTAVSTTRSNRVNVPKIPFDNLLQEAKSMESRIKNWRTRASNTGLDSVRLRLLALASEGMAKLMELYLLESTKLTKEYVL